MTEFGDRIKAWREEKGLTQPAACDQLFPLTHQKSTENAKAVHISQIESGRTVMQDSSPDFVAVMRALRVDETQLLKMLHASQREMRARVHQRTDRVPEPKKPSVAETSKAIDETLAMIAGIAPATSEAAPQARKVKRKSPVKKSPKTEPPKSEPIARDDSGLEGLAFDLSYVLQRNDPSGAISATHHQTLGDFIRRVAVATVTVGAANGSDSIVIAEDMARLMQKRAQSLQIRALPAKQLGEFARRVITSALKLQELGS